MRTLRYIALGTLLISFLVFVAFFGRIPAFRNTPIGLLHRVIWLHIPAAVRTLDQRLTRGRFSPWILRQAQHLWNDRHPVILIFFVLLLGVSELMFIPPAWPLLSKTQRINAAVLVTLSWAFLYASAVADPGYITSENHSHQMILYPYDFTNFYPGQTCHTCHLLKPARSKHCSVCKRCISRLDHHCVFINNCVGYQNQHYFLMLLFTTASLTSYATNVGISLLADEIRREIPEWTFRGKGYTWGGYGNIIGWVLNQQVRIGAITLLCLLTCPLVWGLLTYHVYLIWAGTTTNESMKWSDWRDDMSDGHAFKRTLSKSRPRDPRVEPTWTKWPVESQQVLTRSPTGLPPRVNILGVDEWQRVWVLEDVQNLYDLGFWQNLKDVFWSCPTAA